MTDLSPAEQAVAAVLALDNQTSVVLTLNQSKTIARAVVEAARPLIAAEVLRGARDWAELDVEIRDS